MQRFFQAGNADAYRSQENKIGILLKKNNNSNAKRETQLIDVRIVCMTIIILLTGCSTGSHTSFHIEKNEGGTLTNNTCNPKNAKVLSTILTRKIDGVAKNESTLFIHPGLIFGIDWGGSRASDAGSKLISDGYYENILEVRSRNASPMYEQMIKDNAASYLGLHYSVGASPAVVSEALKASKDASIQQGKPTVYNAILIEPFGFTEFSNYIDPDSPYLGTVFIIASSNYSFLRPKIKSASSKIINHEKFHYIFPEEFGLSWDHFGFLSAVRDEGSDVQQGNKVKGIFYFVVNAIQQKAESNAIEYGLKTLRNKYQLEAGITVHQAVGEDVCKPEVTMMRQPSL